MGVVDSAHPFSQESVSAVRIQLPELSVGVLGAIGRCACEIWGEITLIGMDNGNAVGWVSKGKAADGVARKITMAFCRYCRKHGIEPMRLTIRTFTNASADLLTTGSGEEIVDWAGRRQMKAASLVA